MSRRHKPKASTFDRQIAALGRLMRTKAGREIVTNHRQAILSCFFEGASKS